MARKLKDLFLPGCELLTDASSGSDQTVYHVSSPHALSQAAGYLKYICGPDLEAINFRGQAKLYTKLPPTLFRQSESKHSESIRVNKLLSAIEEIKRSNKIFNQIDARAHEPLLQHYGFNTTWIDLVDNIWVALWFACHKAHATGPWNQYLHFERRDPRHDAGFAYILLISTELTAPDKNLPGYSQGKATETIDLRVSAPSIFLRPHAQHGILFRMRGDANHRPLDYSKRIYGILRIHLADALSWMGEGRLTGVQTFFPPAFHDFGYELLLNSAFIGDEIVGGVHHIGT